MIVWFFHVKVGHRQTPIPKPPTDVGGFLHAYRFSGRIGITGVGIKHWDSDVPVFMEYSCILVFESEIFTLLLFLYKSTESYG